MTNFLRATENTISPAIVLAVVFATLYLGVGPGCFFSVEEVSVLETAQAVLQRGTLEGPAMSGTRRGVADAYYALSAPTLAYVSLPLVEIGNLLDDAVGSMRGGVAQGTALGTEEHPLRWSGRFAIFTALVSNALVGGASVALLFLIGQRLGAGAQSSLLLALTGGLSTLLAVESTHFLSHPLEALGLLLGFWFLSDRGSARLDRRMLLGTTSLGISFLAGPGAAAPAAVLWVYGLVGAWKDRRDEAQDVRTRLRLLLPPMLLGSTPVLAALVIRLWLNHLRFGGFGGFEPEDLATHLGPGLRLKEALLAVSAYLVSPSLGAFVFAPPLVLAARSLGESLRRWPLETWAFLLAAASQLAVVASYTVWHGAIAYGPRYLLASLLLLMPLGLPALERIVMGTPRRLRGLFVLLVVLGLAVQALGLAVYVTVNEWRLAEAGYGGTSSALGSPSTWVFVPSLSPPLVHLREILAGRNIVPWCWRAVKQPGLPLVLWVLLMAVAGVGAAWLRRFYRSGTRVVPQTKVPERLVHALAFLVVVGFLFTGRVKDPLSARAFNELSDGMAAQRDGRPVLAQELYALVLGLEPQNKYALYNLGLLQEDAREAHKATRLFERVLALDPGFTAASAGLARLSTTAAAVAIPPAPASATAPGSEDAAGCHARAQAFWDAADKRAALRVWEECSRRFPGESAFLRNVARCRYDLVDFEGAVRDYRALVTALPNDLVAQTDLAWALLRAGRSDEARVLCEAVLKREPANASAQAVLREIGR
jgi:Flp pilus assembly protein TadD